jgi:hypothetical protein
MEIWNKNITYGNIIEYLRSVGNEAVAVDALFKESYDSLKDSWITLQQFRLKYGSEYIPNFNKSPVSFDNEYLDKQLEVLINTDSTVLILLDNQIFAPPIGVLPKEDMPLGVPDEYQASTRGLLWSLQNTTLRICQDATNWFERAGLYFSLVESVKRFDPQTEYVIKNPNGAVIVYQGVQFEIKYVLDPFAFVFPYGNRSNADVPIPVDNPIPSDGQYIELVSEPTILWLVCQNRLAKEALDYYYRKNVDAYNKLNPDKKVPLIVNPSDISQNKNDQIVPSDLPSSDTTDLVPVNELQSDSEQTKKGDSMTWIVPLLGAVVGMGVIGGIIYYSMKKEEDFGLIGKGNRRIVAEPKSKTPKSKTPIEVANVAKAMKSNAKKAGRPSDSVYVSEYSNEWIIGDNYEKSPYSIIYRNGNWYYRNTWEGMEQKARGGYKEVLDAANMFFTG